LQRAGVPHAAADAVASKLAARRILSVTDLSDKQRRGLVEAVLTGSQFTEQL